jgi:signal transduction histidine kinase
MKFGTTDSDNQLTDADAEWRDLAGQRTVNFASLALGQYRFRVRAVNADGVASVQPATVSFTVLRPVWQRWWFIALTLALLGLTATALYRYRVARLLELERMRTRIATDLHDDIGAGLSRVAILSEVVKRQVTGSAEQSLPLLDEIAGSARSLVESMREIVWAIDPRRDELGNLIARCGNSPRTCPTRKASTGNWTRRRNWNNSNSTRSNAANSS